MAFVHSINSREFSLNQLIISFRLNQFTNSFTKTFIRKNASLDTLVISRIDFRHDHYKWKILGKPGKVDGWQPSAAKISIIKCFDPTLPVQIPKSCCRAVQDDTSWQIWGAERFYRYRASCCAEQPPVSMERSIARCRAWKKLLCNVSCIGRKQDSIFKSGVWTYISCNLWTVWSTNFVFPQIIYWRVLRADTWPGASKVMYLFLVLQSQRQVAEPHSCSMDKTRLLKNTFCGWISISSCPVTVLQSDFKFKLQLHHHIIMQIASLLSLSFQVHCQVDPNWSNGWHRILDRSCHLAYGCGNIVAQYYTALARP